jgi:hypothetical protein
MSDIPSWAKRGAKVVCIKRGRWSHQSRCQNFPVEGGKYTIREVKILGDGGYLLLEEVHNAPRLWGNGDFDEPWFAIFRFRPLVEPKTEAEDREFFRHWLKAPHSTATTRAPAEGADA